MRVHEISFAIAEDYEGAFYAGGAGFDALGFAAGEHKSGYETFGEVVVEGGTAIFGQQFHALHYTAAWYNRA